MSHTPKTFLSSARLKRGVMLDLFAILLLSLAVVSPILISPHFGMFSDYAQILDWAPKCWTDPSGFFKTITPLPDGRWTPMFHMVNVLTYGLLGPHAFGYYFLQWLTLAAVLVAAYLLTASLAHQSRLAGWLACVLILISCPLAENYFTLDKVEPRVLFFTMGSLALFGWGALTADQRPARSGLSLALLFLAHFTLAALNIFSKETAVFIVAVAFAALMAALLQKRRSAKIITEAALFFTGALCAYLLFRFLYYALMPEMSRKMLAESGGVGRYLDYEITPDLIRGNWNAYAGPMRETFIAYAAFIFWCAWEFVTGRFRRWDSRKIVLFTIGSAGVAYASGLLLWRWSCEYFMLPAAALLAVTAIGLAWGVLRNIASNRAWLHWGTALALVLLVAAGTRISRRWFNACALLAVDKAKDKLITAMGEYVPSHPNAVVMLFDVNSAEIGHSLNTYLNLAGHCGKIRVFNFLEGPWVNLHNTERFKGSAAEPPTLKEMNEALQTGAYYLKWKYAPSRPENRVWHVEPLQKGDLILVPVGTGKNGRANARGVAMFTKTLQDYLRGRMLGASVRTLREIRVKFPFSRAWLGWDIVEVTAIQPQPDIFSGLENESSSMDITRLSPDKPYLGKNWQRIEWDDSDNIYRWGENNSEIILPASRGPKTLLLDIEPNTQIALPLPVRVDDHTGAKLALWHLHGRRVVRINVPDYQGADAVLRVRLSQSIKFNTKKICWRLLAIGTADSPVFYGRKYLLMLNPLKDVLVPPCHPDLFGDSALPINQALLGHGWNPALEENQRPIRSAWDNAELVILGQKNLAWKLNMAIVPAPGSDSQPLTLRIVNAQGKAVAERSFTQAENWVVNLPRTASEREIYRIQSSGGAAATDSHGCDWKFRVTSLRSAPVYSSL